MKLVSIDEISSTSDDSFSRSIFIDESFKSLGSVAETTNRMFGIQYERAVAIDHSKFESFLSIVFAIPTYHLDKKEVISKPNINVLYFGNEGNTTGGEGVLRFSQK